MAEKRDYYEVLSVSREATVQEITKSYRSLAIKFHPDKNPGDEEAATRFKEISEAYDVLRDDDKRARYDRYGHAGVDGAVPNFDDAGVLNDWLGNLGDIGDLLGSFFGGGGRRRSGRRQGRDLEITVEIDLAEAFRGVTQKLRVPKQIQCPKCEGARTLEKDGRKTCQTCGGQGVVVQSLGGFFQVQQACPACRQSGFVITKPCKECRGQGAVLIEEEVEVQIPPGMPHGAQIPIPGAGEAGERGAPAGDLYVAVLVKEHSVFQREGDTLACRVPVTISQAALGAEIEIPTIEGKMINYQLPKGIQSFDFVKISKQGMPNVRTGRRGDLQVQIVVETPRKLTRRQEELFRELAELEDVNVSSQRKSWFDRVRDFFRDSDEIEDDN